MVNLVLEDFGVKHLNDENSDHPIKALKDKYEDAEVNWEGDKLIKLAFNGTITLAHAKST